MSELLDEKTVETDQAAKVDKPWLFKKGVGGNPAGRPKGISALSTELRQMLKSRSTELLQSVIDAAVAGDMRAAKICIERIIPLAKNCMSFALPDLTHTDSNQLVKELFEAMSHQVMSADEIKQVLDLVKTFRHEEDTTQRRSLLADLKDFEQEMRAKHESDI